MQNFSRRNLIALALTLATPFSIMASGSLRLEDLCTKLSFGNVILASFTAKKKIPGVHVNLKSSGRIVLWRNHGLLWQTTSPFAETLVFGRHKTLTLDESGTQSIHETKQIDGVIARVEAMLNEDTREIYDHFFVSLSGSSKAWRLVISPKNSSIAQYLTEICLEGTHLINRALIVQTDTTISEILFHHQQILETPPSDCMQLFTAVL